MVLEGCPCTVGSVEIIRNAFGPRVVRDASFCQGYVQFGVDVMSLSFFCLLSIASHV
jgi:hypothetical protein